MHPDSPVSTPARTLTATTSRASPSGPDPRDSDLVTHVEGCPSCRTEVDELRELADLARSVRTERLEPPPPHVWQGVVDELGLSPRSRPRAAPWAWAVAAAVAGVVAGSLVTWALVDDDAPAVAAPEVVRTAALERLAGSGDGGTARLLEDADGRQTVEVSAPDLGSADGHFEVWLIRPDSTQMVSIGVLGAGDTGAFVVPEAASRTATPSSTSRTSPTTASRPTPATRCCAATWRADPGPRRALLPLDGARRLAGDVEHDAVDPATSLVIRVEILASRS